MRYLLALIICLIATPALADARIFFMAAVDNRDVYTFTSDPVPPWTITGGSWDGSESVIMGNNTTGYLDYTSLVHATGLVTVEFMQVCVGNCSSWIGPYVNGVALTWGAPDTWVTSTVSVTGSTGLRIYYDSLAVGKYLKVRKVTVPKP